ncbi:hypothetical protein D9613_012366 [Agrocybe pediades]|uniref:Ubiquitin 3 binding protein But2 C-terminal domain-containing protein n=1 Tax=Agrocybe pediades TaxID=84607 RepID=A0A8H4QRR3_9AGAR|nr:hypothetical protein D9613_012366 [Agrocybe pediades]
MGTEPEQDPLLQFDDSESNETPKKRCQTLSSVLQTDISLALVAIATLVAIISLGVSLKALSITTDTRSGSPIQVVSRPTRRINQYIRLSDPGSPHASDISTRIGHAQVVLQMEAHSPTRILMETTRQHSTSVGTVFPDDRYFCVSNNLSTVVQLRAIDFGFNSCVLSAAIPHTTRTLNTSAVVKGNSIINVWELNTTEELSPHGTFWRTAPPRRRLFAQFTFDEQRTWSSRSFPCASGSFHTYEFACNKHDPGCHVEFWQDREAQGGTIPYCIPERLTNEPHCKQESS